MNRKEWLDWRIRVIGVARLIREQIARGPHGVPPETVAMLTDIIERAPSSDPDPPIPMRLICEGCGELHIDEGEFATKPHHTHECQNCGLTWRPADPHTVGVRFVFRKEPNAPAVRRDAIYCTHASPRPEQTLGRLCPCPSDCPCRTTTCKVD